MGGSAGFMRSCRGLWKRYSNSYEIEESILGLKSPPLFPSIGRAEARPYLRRKGLLAGDCEGGFDGVGDAVVAVGGADAPAAGGGEKLEVRGRVVHEDGGAGDFEHGDVVPVVADGEDLGGVDAAGGGEGEQGRTFGAAGGEDVEDGEVAVGVLGAVEGEEGFGVGGADRAKAGRRLGGRITSHPLR